MYGLDMVKIVWHVVHIQEVLWLLGICCGICIVRQGEHSPKWDPSRCVPVGSNTSQLPVWWWLWCKCGLEGGSAFGRCFFLILIPEWRWQGGNPHRAFEHIAEQGIPDQTCQPYMGYEGECDALGTCKICEKVGSEYSTPTDFLLSRNIARTREYECFVHNHWQRVDEQQDKILILDMSCIVYCLGRELHCCWGLWHVSCERLWMGCSRVNIRSWTQSCRHQIQNESRNLQEWSNSMHNACNWRV